MQSGIPTKCVDKSVRMQKPYMHSVVDTLPDYKEVKHKEEFISLALNA